MEQFEESPDESPGSSFLIEEKSLTRWRFELKSLPKKHWNVFYTHFLGVQISSYQKFYRALKLYGEMPMFEAVLAAARQSIEGDPLNYVLKITHSLWREEQLEIDKASDEEKRAVEAAAITKKQNQLLAKKLSKLKRG